MQHVRPQEVCDRPGRPGAAAVIGITCMAAAFAAFAVWFQWNQTRRCLTFFGPRVAAAIQQAPRVEVWRLGGGQSAAAVRAAARFDISRARGLVHLRHGLVEDSNYVWESPPPRPAADWDVALAFFAAGSAEPTAVLAFDIDDEGAVTVVGKPGTIRLGRISRALREWLPTAVPDGAAAG